MATRLFERAIVAEYEHSVWLNADLCVSSSVQAAVTLCGEVLCASRVALMLVAFIASWFSAVVSPL
jgi:hypothetical protein